MTNQRLHSERYVAARCVLSLEDLGQTLTALGADAASLFADPGCHGVVAVAVRLLLGGQPVSRSTVRLEMKAQGIFPGDEWFSALSGEAIEEGDLAYHLGAIRQAHAVRQASDIVGAAQQIFLNGSPLSSKVDAIGHAASELLQASRTSEVAQTGAAIADANEELFLTDCEAQTVRHRSMYHALNTAFAGYVVGRIALCMAESNHGKTTFADWEAINAARLFRSAAEHGGPKRTVRIYDVENTPGEKHRMLIAKLAGLSPRRLEEHVEGRRRLTPEEREAVRRALAELRTLPLSVSQASSAEEIYADAYAASLAAPVGFVVVDYAQVLTDKAPSKREQVMQSAQTLHDMARRLKSVVLVGSQVTLPKDYTGAPRIHDVAESRDLYKVAATVLALYHPAAEWEQKGYEGADGHDPQDYRVYVRKHKGEVRMGGCAALRFDTRRLAITDRDAVKDFSPNTPF